MSLVKRLKRQHWRSMVAQHVPSQYRPDEKPRDPRGWHDVKAVLAKVNEKCGRKSARASGYVDYTAIDGGSQYISKRLADEILRPLPPGKWRQITLAELEREKADGC